MYMYCYLLHVWPGLLLLVALRDVEALLLLEQLHDRPNGPTGQVGLGCGRRNLGQQQLIELDPQLTKHGNTRTATRGGASNSIQPSMVIVCSPWRT